MSCLGPKGCLGPNQTLKGIRSQLFRGRRLAAPRGATWVGRVSGPSRPRGPCGALFINQAVSRRLGPIIHHFEGIFEHFCQCSILRLKSGKYSGFRALRCQNVAQNVGHRRKFDQRSEKTGRNVQILQIVKNWPYTSRMMYYGPQGASWCQRGAGFSVGPSFWPRCLTIGPTRGPKFQKI